MIVCDWGHWRLLVWPYFAHFTKKWGETPKTREKSGISGRSKPVGFFGGSPGMGYYFPRQGYIVNQRIWQFTNQILAKTTNRWGRKSLQKIRQHHQIGEEISTVCTIFVQFWTPGKGDEFWKSRFFLRFRIRWRCTPAPKVRVFHQIVQSLRPTNSEMTWKIENGLKCKGTEGPQLRKVEFAISMSQNGCGSQWNLRFEAVIFLYLFKKKNTWDNKLLKSGVATTTKPTNFF